MLSLKEALSKNRLVLDGAMGTELEACIPKDSKIQPRKHPLWSGLVLLNEPNLIKNVHYNYLEQADVDALISSTYQISYPSLKEHTDLDDEQIRGIWKKSIDVVEDAILQYRSKNSNSKKKIYIIGSIGPYATYLADGSEYTGDYKNASDSDIELYHQPLLEYFLGDDRVDTIGFETIPSFQEVKVVLKLLSHLFAEQEKRKYYYISFNFDEATITDGTPTEVVISYIDSFLDKYPFLRKYMVGLGLNCIDYHKIGSIVAKINDSQTSAQKPLFPLIVYPNFTIKYVPEEDDYRAYKDIEKWKELVSEWVTIPNVRMIGGCCSTSPKEIKEVRRIIGT